MTGLVIGLLVLQESVRATQPPRSEAKIELVQAVLVPAAFAFVVVLLLRLFTMM